MADNAEKVSIYISATGEIIANTYRLDGVNPTLDVGQALIDGHYEPADFYILAGVPTERPELREPEEEIYLDLNASTPQTLITSIPNATIVSADDDFYQVASGAQALTVLAARVGEFDFEVIPPFPHKALSFRLVVTDAG